MNESLPDSHHSPVDRHHAPRNSSNIVDQQPETESCLMEGDTSITRLVRCETRMQTFQLAFQLELMPLIELCIKYRG
jgi:hypothetical protein